MISVIIPIYNGERYLAHCLDSVLCSTYSDFELLLINDGSTDRSLEICTEYARRDSRIKLFSQENKGVSAARNRGLDECAGEWIVFVDADDVISPDFLELIAAEDYSAQDVLLFDFAGTEEELLRTGKQTGSFPSDSEKRRYAGDDTMVLLREMLRFGQLVEGGNVNLNSSNARAFKKSIIDQYAIRFSPSLTYGEDTVFDIEYQLKAENWVYAPVPVYFYNIHADSSFHRTGLNVRMEKLEAIKCVFEKSGIFPLLEREYRECYSNTLDDFIAFMLIRIIFSPYSTRSHKEKRILCRELWGFEFCQKARPYFYTCGTLRRRIVLFAFRMRWYLALDAISRYSYLRLKRKNPAEIEELLERGEFDDIGYHTGI